MARKYEFKQDKQGAGIFSKLFLTRKQRRSVLRWALYALVLLVASVVQDVIMCRFSFWGATTELVPCGIILICILEGAQKSCIFALIASTLLLFSGGAPGVYSLVFLTVLAICAAIFREAYLQKGFLSTLFCAGLALVLYCLAHYAMGIFLQLTMASRLWAFLLRAGLTLPALAILYPICTSIEAMGGTTWKE